MIHSIAYISWVYINWDISPEAFSLFGFAVRWYGVLFALGFLVGGYILSYMYKLEGKKVEQADKLLMYIIIGTIIGSRLGHCLFYNPEYYLSNPIKILNIREGGLASHGGGIGIFTAIWLYHRKFKFPYLWILDRIAILTALGGACIRLGNLMNSEILGIPTDLPWAFVFENSYYPKVPRHPAQLYESLSCLVIFIVLFTYYLRNKGKLVEGRIFGIFMFILFTLRFFYEFIKENQEAFEADMLLNMGQLLSIPFVLTGLYVLFLYKPKKSEG